MAVVETAVCQRDLPDFIQPLETGIVIYIQFKGILFFPYEETTVARNKMDYISS